MSHGTVAIVGKPNVGKSTIFNRIVQKRISIVEDTPGVTRDRIYAKCDWLTREFSVIDTGGIEIKDAPFQAEIKAQVQVALEEADVIVMVVSSRDGITRDDEFVARMLQKTSKEVVLVVNKCDNEKDRETLNDFWSLGVGEPHGVSSLHGMGVGDVLDQIVLSLPKHTEVEEDDSLKFCVIGKPNVGKSSLTNALMKEDRVIVSEIAGTTRDAIDTKFERNGKEYTVIDTAGMRKRGRIYENIEKYSVLRAHTAIDRANICVLVLDGSQPITDQDLNISGFIHENQKPCIIVVNKWDLVSKDTNTMHKFEKDVRAHYHHLAYAPIVFLSAKDETRIDKLVEQLDVVHANMKKRIKTSILNEILTKAQLLNPAPDFNGGRLNLYYGNQPEIIRPTFILFVNNPEWVHFSYKRFLENQIREHFDFAGVPLRLQFRERK